MSAAAPTRVPFRPRGRKPRGRSLLPVLAGLSLLSALCSVVVNTLLLKKTKKTSERKVSSAISERQQQSPFSHAVFLLTPPHAAAPPLSPLSAVLASPLRDLPHWPAGDVRARFIDCDAFRDAAVAPPDPVGPVLVVVASEATEEGRRSRRRARETWGRGGALRFWIPRGPFARSERERETEKARERDGKRDRRERPPSNVTAEPRPEPEPSNEDVEAARQLAREGGEYGDLWIDVVDRVDQAVENEILWRFLQEKEHANVTWLALLRDQGAELHLDSLGDFLGRSPNATFYTWEKSNLISRHAARVIVNYKHCNNGERLSKRENYSRKSRRGQRPFPHPHFHLASFHPPQSFAWILDTVSNTNPHKSNWDIATVNEKDIGTGVDCNGNGGSGGPFRTRPPHPCPAPPVRQNPNPPAAVASLPPGLDLLRKRVADRNAAGGLPRLSVLVVQREDDAPLWRWFQTGGRQLPQAGEPELKTGRALGGWLTNVGLRFLARKFHGVPPEKVCVLRVAEGADLKHLAAEERTWCPEEGADTTDDSVAALSLKRWEEMDGMSNGRSGRSDRLPKTGGTAAERDLRSRLAHLRSVPDPKGRPKVEGDDGHDGLSKMGPYEIVASAGKIEEPTNSKDTKATNDTTHLIVSYSRPALLKHRDMMETFSNWDGVPIVLEEHRLLLFTVPKVGCTVVKQFARRVAGLPNWKTQKRGDIPNNPDNNGLKYLNHYLPSEAQEMMTSPLWTRAIFVRDPKVRFLSAYLDKALTHRGDYVQGKCFQKQGAKWRTIMKDLSFEKFLNITEDCHDPHWMPLSNRVDEKYLPYINFVVHLENAVQDMRRLLRRVDASRDHLATDDHGGEKQETAGLWETFGAKGWNGGAIYMNTTTHHRTGAHSYMEQYYTGNLGERVERRFATDYEKELFGLDKPQHISDT